jgi:hypothetical protein
MFLPDEMQHTMGIALGSKRSTNMNSELVLVHQHQPLVADERSQFSEERLDVLLLSR